MKTIEELKLAAENALAEMPARTGDKAMSVILSIEEFERELHASTFARCDGCGKKTALADLIETDNGQYVFCSESCKWRETAPLIKPQPSNAEIPAELIGWI